MMHLSKQDRNRGWIFGGLFLMFLIIFSGCAASNYGKLESKKSVAEEFQNYQVLPNHKYYFAGVKSQPSALVGINQNYVLTDRMWTEIDPHSDDFRLVTDRVLLMHSDFLLQAWGFVILDGDGNQAGVWYSAIRAAAVRINEDRQIVKLFPMQHRAIGEQR